LPSTIERLHEEFEGRGLAVLAVNIREPRDVVARWVRRSRVTVPILLDAAGKVTGPDAYHVRGTPTVVLVGRDGRMVGRAVANRNWTGDAGRALFEALLAQPAR
jgi:hypothetical protein